ncbi:MAG: SDR family oxidoreductase [Acidobacteria bacterium]|nr:SDR family oxidoreductase [Acidobacteriota bacterium]MBI3263799.1 SDR family oxidoreductase [Acidobacteriota bacterium]
MPLIGKIALITGGSRGIGRAMAGALVREGAAVAISGRTERDLETAAAELSATASQSGAPPVLTVRADVGRSAEATQLVDEAARHFGGLDVLVNNAGVGFFSPVADLPLERWEETMATNLSAPFYCARAAIPHLRRRGGGWIINISSLAGKNPFAGGGAYCASKAALNAFSEVLMQEVRFDDIKVSYILPGSVQTRFSGHDEAGADWKIDPDEVAQVVLDLLHQAPRSLSSRIELRPSKPRK